MSQIHRVINTYYDDFESYDCVFKANVFRFWLCLFSLSFFFTMILWRVDFIEVELLEELEHFKNIFLFSSEILFGIFFISLNFLKDKIILKRLQTKLGVQDHKWQKLKYLWLQRTVDVDQHNYISLAKDLDTMFDLRKKYKSNLFLSWDNVVGLIYTTDAKNRIIAMLIAISAATIALSISAGANINYVFELFHENSLYDFFKWDFLISITVMSCYFGVRLVVQMIYVALYQLSDKFKRVNQVDNLRIKLFINMLLDMHEFKKARIKVDVKE